MAYTLNMDVIITMFTQHADITNMWILSKWLKILWLNARYWEMTARSLEHTGIGYRFVEEKIEL
jgi:hypothetical protein